MATIASLTVKIGATTDKFLKSMDKAIDRTMDFAKTSAVAAAKAGAGIALATAGVAAASGRMAAQFETDMANVGSLLGKEGSGRVKELGEDVKRLAQQTGKPLGDLAGGLYQVVSAFGDSADSAKILEISAKAASAGLADTNSVVNLLASVTKGYGDTTADAVQKVSDLAFATVKLGQTTMPELAASMGKAVPLAATLGVEMESLFGAMATLTGVTGNTAEVATQLRATMQALINPTDQMKEALTQIGFASGAAAVESLGLQGTLQALEQATGGNTQQMAKMFGSVEALNAVLALVGPQAQNFTDKTAAMGQAAGEAAIAFDIQQKSVNAMVDKLKQTVNVMLVNLGERFLPTLQKLAEWVAKNMPAIQKFFEQAFDMIGKGAEWVGDNALPLIEKGIDKVKAVMPDLKAAAEDAFDAIKKAVGPVIETVQDVAKWFEDLAKTIERQDWAKVGRTLGEGLATAIESITDLGVRLAKWVGKQIASVNWADVGRKALPVLVGFILGFVDALLDPITWVRIVAEHWEIILGLVIGLIAAPAKWVGKIATALGKIPLIGTLLKWLVTNVSDFGKKAFEPVGKALSDFGGAIMKGFGDAIGSAKLFPAFKKMLTGGMKALADGAETAYLNGLYLMERLGAGIANLGPKQLVNNLRLVWTYVDDFLVKAVKGMSEIGGNIVRGLWNGITALGSWLKDKVGSFIQETIPEWAKKLLGIMSPSRVMAEIGRDVVAGLAVGMESEQGKLMNATSKVVGAMELAVSGLTEYMAGQARADVEKWLQKVGPDALRTYTQAEAALVALEQQLREVGGALQDAKMDMIAKENALNRAAEAVKQAQSDYERWEKVLRNVQTAIDKTEASIKTLADATKVSQDAIRSAFQDMGDYVSDLERRIKDAESAMRGLAGVKLAGETALEDELFALRQQENLIKLAINAAKRTKDTAFIENLEKQLDAIGLEQERIQLVQTIKFEPLRRELQRMVDETKEMGFEEAKSKILAYQTQITDLTKEHAKAKTEMETLRLSVSALIGETQRLTFTQAVAAVEDHRQKIVANQAQIVELTATLTDQKSMLALVTGEMETLKKKIEDELIPAQEAAQKAYDAAKTVVDNLTAAQSDLQTAIDKVRSGMDTMVSRIKDAYGALDELTPAARAAAQATIALAQAANVTAAAMASVKGSGGGQGTPSFGGKVLAMADGGVVRRPTLALIGEAGPERVEPLKNDTKQKQTVVIPINIGGQTIETLVVTGLQVAVRRGIVDPSVLR